MISHLVYEFYVYIHDVYKLSSFDKPNKNNTTYFNLFSSLHIEFYYVYIFKLNSSIPEYDMVSKAKEIKRYLF